MPEALPDGIDVSALDDACYEYHREYVSDRDADHLAPRVTAIRDALGLGDAQPGGLLRHAVREWMDADRDYNELRSTIVSDLHILADRDEVTTGDIHALADEIESGGQFEPVSQHFRIANSLWQRLDHGMWTWALWDGPDEMRAEGYVLTPVPAAAAAAEDGGGER
jgi:hypothetical protein